jgi:lysozyme
MELSARGLALIKEFEGFSPTVYEDQSGAKHIGYGHKMREWEHYGRVTPEEAERLLLTDLHWAEWTVNAEVDVPLNQNQFDALVSLVFNIGFHAFVGSNLRKFLNRGDYTRAAAEFARWNRVSRTEISLGLTRRRAKEQTLFLEE